MYGYISWPGVYSFKEEIGMFMEYLREQMRIMKKIEDRRCNCKIAIVKHRS